MILTPEHLRSYPADSPYTKPWVFIAVQEDGTWAEEWDVLLTEEGASRAEAAWDLFDMLSQMEGQELEM